MTTHDQNPANTGDSGSQMLRKVQYKLNGALQAEQVREYDPGRDLLTSIRMDWDPAGTLVTKSRYDYRYDGLGRRTDVVYSGAAFGGSGNEQLDLWAYNNRNELTGVNRHEGDDPAAPGTEDTDLRRAYNYDPIGNRKTYTEGTAAALYYCANALNQYEETGADADCVPFTEEFLHDADGNLIAGGAGVSARTYTWDAENRLVAVEPAGTPGPGDGACKGG